MRKFTFKLPAFLKTMVLLLIIAACSRGIFTTTAASEAVGRAAGAALQGDAAAAAKILAEIPATKFAWGDASFRTCMIDRFGPNGRSVTDLGIGDAWVNSLAQAYVAYWQRVLTNANGRAEAEDELAQSVGNLIGHPLHIAVELDGIEDEIQAAVNKRGLHALLRRTAPFREFMLWRKQTTDQRQVNLPEGGPFPVKVTFLDDFLVRGWGYYATCGRSPVGGWATADGLFAVVPSYSSLTDEIFSVRFVAHESQHFSDKQAFGNLENWELEYRAKLVELALADASQVSTLEGICGNRGKDKNVPHAYADSKIVSEIDLRLKVTSNDAGICGSRRVSGQAIREAARAALLDDSEQRRH
jgi:hypothetical protein